MRRRATALSLDDSESSESSDSDDAFEARASSAAQRRIWKTAGTLPLTLYAMPMKLTKRPAMPQRIKLNLRKNKDLAMRLESYERMLEKISNHTEMLNALRSEPAVFTIQIYDNDVESEKKVQDRGTVKDWNTMVDEVQTSVNRLTTRSSEFFTTTWKSRDYTQLSKNVSPSKLEFLKEQEARFFLGNPPTDEIHRARATALYTRDRKYSRSIRAKVLDFIEMQTTKATRYTQSLDRVKVTGAMVRTVRAALPDPTTSPNYDMTAFTVWMRQITIQWNRRHGNARRERAKHAKRLRNKSARRKKKR